MLKFWTHCSNCSSFVSSALPSFWRTCRGRRRREDCYPGKESGHTRSAQSPSPLTLPTQSGSPRPVASVTQPRVLGPSGPSVSQLLGPPGAGLSPGLSSRHPGFPHGPEEPLRTGLLQRPTPDKGASKTAALLGDLTPHPWVTGLHAWQERGQEAPPHTHRTLFPGHRLRTQTEESGPRLGGGHSDEECGEGGGAGSSSHQESAPDLTDLTMLRCGPI